MGLILNNETIKQANYVLSIVSNMCDCCCYVKNPLKFAFPLEFRKDSDINEGGVTQWLVMQYSRRQSDKQGTDLVLSRNIIWQSVNWEHNSATFKIIRRIVSTSILRRLQRRVNFQVSVEAIRDIPEDLCGR